MTSTLCAANTHAFESEILGKYSTNSLARVLPLERVASEETIDNIALASLNDNSVGVRTIRKEDDCRGFTPIKSIMATELAMYSSGIVSVGPERKHTSILELTTQFQQTVAPGTGNDDARLVKANAHHSDKPSN